jgi:hypothetical protein
VKAERRKGDDDAERNMTSVCRSDEHVGMNPRDAQTGPLVLVLESQETERILEQDKRAVLCRDLGTHGLYLARLRDILVF